MNDLLTRLAQALHRVRHEPDVVMARTALEVMRGEEPPLEMQTAGFEAIEGTTDFAGQVLATNCWRAMIDEALRE